MDILGKHRIKGLTVTIFMVCLYLVSGDVSLEGAEEGGHAGLLCSDCHTMHYSKRGEIPPGSEPGGPFVELILTQTTNQLCLNCHDGSDPDAPNVENPTGYESAAGHFTVDGIVVEGNRHSLGSSEPPPGYSGGTWSEALTCTSCHEPHGKNTYRNLVEHPGGQGPVEVTVMRGPVYDGAAAVQEIAGEPITVRYSVDNIRYRKSIEGGDRYGLSEWCGGCHGDFHGPGGSGAMGGSPAGDIGPGSEWIRHPSMDVTMSEGFRNGNLGSDNWFSRLSSRVPVVSPTEIPGSQSNSDNEVFCGSCHKAHGSDRPHILIYDDDQTPDRNDGTRMSETCTQCHIGSSYLVSPHGDGEEGVERVVTDPPTVGDCSQCHYMHSSVGGEPTGGPFVYGLFDENTNGLCFDPSGRGGCHREVPSGYPAQEIDRIPEGTQHPGYFETNSGGVKIPGVNNRRRWPGMITYTDQRAFGTDKYYSPHRNDSDMPLRDLEGRGICANCHNPHGTENPFDMLVGTYLEIGGSEEVTPPGNYSLCFGCHGPDGPFGMNDSGRRIADFYDSRINNDGQAGHQIRLSDDIAISWPNHIRKGDKLPCYNCHNAHGSMGNDGVQPNGYLISDQREGWSGLTDTLNDPEQARRFCLGCHIPSDGIPGSRSVEGIIMNTIPDEGDFHRSSDQTSCYDCHGRDYSSPTGYNVHHPSEGEDESIRMREHEFEKW